MANSAYLRARGKCTTECSGACTGRFALLLQYHDITSRPVEHTRYNSSTKRRPLNQPAAASGARKDPQKTSPRHSAQMSDRPEHKLFVRGQEVFELRRDCLRTRARKQPPARRRAARSGKNYKGFLLTAVASRWKFIASVLHRLLAREIRQMLLCMRVKIFPPMTRHASHPPRQITFRSASPICCRIDCRRFHA